VRNSEREDARDRVCTDYVYITYRYTYTSRHARTLAHTYTFSLSCREEGFLYEGLVVTPSTMGIIKMVDKLVAALNPFFRHYTKHRVIAFLVALVMIAGTIGIYLQNSACTFTTTTESGVEKVIGDWADQKSFVDQKMALANPDGLPEGTERFVEMCTWDTRPNGAELGEEICHQPANEYWEHPVMSSFPHAFHWCTMEEAERTPEAKSAIIQKSRLIWEVAKTFPMVSDWYRTHNALIDQIQKDPESTMWSLQMSATKAVLTSFVNTFKSGKCQDGDYEFGADPDCLHNVAKWNGNLIPGMVSDGKEPEDLLWVHTQCILATAPFNVDKYKDRCEYMDSYPETWQTCHSSDRSSCLRPQWCGLCKGECHMISCPADELMVDHLDDRALELFFTNEGVWHDDEVGRWKPDGYQRKGGTVASRRALFCNMFYSVA